MKKKIIKFRRLRNQETNRCVVNRNIKDILNGTGIMLEKKMVETSEQFKALLLSYVKTHLAQPSKNL